VTRLKCNSAFLGLRRAFYLRGDLQQVHGGQDSHYNAMRIGDWVVTARVRRETFVTLSNNTRITE
jgi:hypothetical protein